MPWGNGPMVESTFSCKLYQPGGPTPGRLGSVNRGSRVLSSEQGVLESSIESIKNPGTAVALTAVGLFAFIGTLLKQRRWANEEVAGEDFVLDQDNRKYHYEVIPGGKRVRIYLPNGLKVDHSVTAAAVRDSYQLQDEVMALIKDIYYEPL